MNKPQIIEKIRYTQIGKLYVVEGYVFCSEELTKISKETHPEYFL